MSNEIMAEVDSSIDTSPSMNGWRAAGRLSWIGQTIASGCWIVSVFFYGVSSVGDVLQLLAASAWMVANVAALYESST